MRRHDNILPPDQWPWDSIKTLLLAPGIPFTHPKPHPVVEMAKKAGAEIICDVELLYRLAPEATYIGITGTNGKSTTTALIGHILKEAGKNVQVGGNIGVAAASLLKLGAGGIYVLELSSYQLDLLNTMRFRVAALLNITPDHLDRHGGMEGYITAKLHIFDRQSAGDAAIIVVDDDYTKRIAATLCHPEQSEGTHAAGDPSPSAQDDTPKVIRISADAPPAGISAAAFKRLPGRHNVQNMTVAYAVAREMGVAHEVIIRAIGSFPGLDHRLQWIAEKDGTTFINDSKATNAVATEQALRAFCGCHPERSEGSHAAGDPSPSAQDDKRIYWLLGGLPKEGGIESLREYFPCVRHAFLFGQAAPEFAKTLEGGAPYTQCGTLETAFAKAASLAEKDGGGVVLLSPACASFDQFLSFEHRGEVFRDLARAWEAQRKAL